MKNKNIDFINICCLCNIPEHNHSLITQYSQFSQVDFIHTNDKYTFIKQIANKTYEIKFYSSSKCDDYYRKEITESTGIILLFDTTNRTEFEDILSKWLVYLRDKWFFTGHILILGEDREVDNNRIGKVVSSDNIREEEVEDSIKTADMPNKIEYVRLSIKPLDTVIDSFMIKANKIYKFLMEIEDSESISKVDARKDICYIY